ncbi:MAG: hypothetical protein V4773_26710 [Verrucomicrobiota bacterium]
MATSTTLQPSTRAPRWFVWLGLIALIGYGFFISRHATVAAGGSDSSGYLNSAKLLASGKLEIPVRLPAGFGPPDAIGYSQFQPLGFTAFSNDTRLIPTYPTGLPLHVALASKLLGWSLGPLFLQILGSMAALWLCYVVAREFGLELSLAAASVIILAACPVMIFSSTQPLSDLLATTWCLAAVWCALRARRHAGWAIACGAAYGIAVLVRPTNTLLAGTLLVLLGLDWRRLALGVVGGLPCVVWLAFYNHTLYGGALRSGYDNWSVFFAVRYFKPASIYFLQWLATFLPVIVLALPFAALFRRETRTRDLLALALWFAPITGLYLFVAFSHEAWTCLRYILPGIPALIIAAMFGVEAIARSLAEGRRAPLVRRVAAVVLAGWAVGMSSYWSPRNSVFHIKHHEDAYITSAAAALAQFPKNAMVVCCHTSGAIYHYTDFPVLRFDGMPPGEFARYAGMAQRVGVPIYGLLFSAEEEQTFRECPGEWTRLATVDGVGLWQLVAAKPAPVPTLK